MAFAEVERFIDTPVKHYSSGMYLRLAFAVAAPLSQPEITSSWTRHSPSATRASRKKCLDKMEDVSHHGRTVLFVSHNMPAVTRLCPRTVLLDGGKVLSDGKAVPDVVSAYLRGTLGTTAVRVWTANHPGNAIARLLAVRVLGPDGTPRDAMDIRTKVGIEIEYEVLSGGHVLVPNIHFVNEEGVGAFLAADTTESARRSPKPEGIYRTVGWIPGNFLSEGTYIAHAALSTMNPMVVHFFERDAMALPGGRQPRRRLGARRLRRALPRRRPPEARVVDGEHAGSERRRRVVSCRETKATSTATGSACVRGRVEIEALPHDSVLGS